MGYDYEKKQFTPDNHEMLPSQVVQMICELEPGEVCYVAESAMWVDRSDKRQMWIDGYKAAYSDEDVMFIGEADPSKYARVICIEDGLIVDFSHLNRYLWPSLKEKFYSPEWPHDKISDVKVKPMPVIHCVFNEEELALIEPTLEGHNIQLDGFDLQTILNVIDEFDSDDDDELSDEEIEEHGEYDDED